MNKASAESRQTVSPWNLPLNEALYAPWLGPYADLKKCRSYPQAPTRSFSHQLSSLMHWLQVYLVYKATQKAFEGNQPVQRGRKL